MSLVAVQLDTLLSLGSTGLRTANVADLDVLGIWDWLDERLRVAWNQLNWS